MKELKVTPIKDGTVIDHIPSGQALKVLRVLKLPQSTSSVVSVVMNVNGKKGKKDIVKIENRELDPKELNKIALIAPNATINIIRDYDVVKKHTVELPNEVIGLTKCSNPTCISNAREPVESRFHVVCKDPLRIRCYYCEREPEDITEGIM
ncbi:MAG: aspartate carbamoyltransferase regulatory subunit [Candidatus Thermoplasmatota archaeon]|nr:aspartate carbamoyltransferase regulatory subunit [Candidatus Thermoplasmatota archaeon]